MHDGNDACSLTYAWLSDGTPVSATLGEGNLPGRLYNGSFVFVTDSTRIDIAESVAWDEGRIFFLDPDTTDCWYAGDHLGNVRSVIDISKGQAVPQVLEQSDYLPYGTRINNTAFASMSGENRWRYAAKEEQRLSCLVTDPFAPDGGYNRSLDLGLLNFGARMYDPFTARWTAVDPMAKNTFTFTSYAYCTDNSITRFDPDGNAAHIAIGVIVGAAIEGGIAVYQGKSTREVVGAMARGAIEGGVIAATFGAGAGVAIAGSTAASAVGSMADQKISNGSIDAKTVAKDAATGLATGVGGAVVSKGLGRVSSAAKKTIEANYASSTVHNKIRNEIKRELRNEGKKVKGSTLNQLEKERVANHCNAETAFVDFVNETVDYSVQKNINSVVEEIQH